jgi:hypothetical protein
VRYHSAMPVPQARIFAELDEFAVAAATARKKLIFGSFAIGIVTQLLGWGLRFWATTDAHVETWREVSIFAGVNGESPFERPTIVTGTRGIWGVLEMTGIVLIIMSAIFLVAVIIFALKKPKPPVDAD